MWAGGQHPALSHALWHPPQLSGAAVGLGLGLGPGEQLGWAGPGRASQAGTTVWVRGAETPQGGVEGLRLLQGHFLGEQGGWERWRGVRKPALSPHGALPAAWPCATLPCPRAACPQYARWARGGERAAPQEPGDSPRQRFSPGWLQLCPGPWLCRSPAGSRLSGSGTSRRAVLRRCPLGKRGAFLL